MSGGHATGERVRWGAVVAVVLVLGTVSCGKERMPCPAADLPYAEDVRTAKEALAAASSDVGMAGIATEEGAMSFQRDTNLPGTGPEEYQLVRVIRSMTVEYPDATSAVEAFEAEGFEIASGDPGADHEVVLERGQQRATVEVGVRHATPGQKIGTMSFTLAVTTGCRLRGT